MTPIPRTENAYDKHAWIIISEGLRAPAKEALAKGEAVEFSVNHEPWTKYLLNDGTRLFGRVIVTKIVRTREYEPSGEPIYAWFNQAIFSAVPPKRLKGRPSDPPPESLGPEEFHLTPVEFERVGGEDWNVYQLSDGTVMRVQLDVTGVYRTDKYGHDGDPYYVVGSKPIQKLKVQAHLMKKECGWR